MLLNMSTSWGVTMLRIIDEAFGAKFEDVVAAHEMLIRSERGSATLIQSANDVGTQGERERERKGSG